MSDFSPYLAGEIVDWMSQGTAFDGAPSDLYVTVFDDTNTERDGSLTGARAAVPTDTGWTVTATSFENADDVSLGEASEDISNITDVALYDAETDGNQLARYEINEAPFTVADGSTLTFQAGELSFDVVDNTQ